MDRYNSLTHIPISNEIFDTRLNFDDNASNVKVLSKKKLESLDDVLINRNHEMSMLMQIKDDINNDIISKLDKILSKRFKLKKNDYIILIDRYGLKNGNITRKCINDMVEYLNLTNKYDENKDDEKKDIFVQNSENKYYNHASSLPSSSIKQEAGLHIKPNYANPLPKISRKKLEVSDADVMYKPLKTEYNDEELPKPIQTQTPNVPVNVLPTQVEKSSLIEPQIQNPNKPVRQLVGELRKMDEIPQDTITMIPPEKKIDNDPIDFDKDLERLMNNRNMDDNNDNSSEISENGNLDDTSNIQPQEISQDDENAMELIIQEMEENETKIPNMQKNHTENTHTLSHRSKSDNPINLRNNRRITKTSNTAELKRSSPKITNKNPDTIIQNSNYRQYTNKASSNYIGNTNPSNPPQTKRIPKGYGISKRKELVLYASNTDNNTDSIHSDGMVVQPNQNKNTEELNLMLSFLNNKNKSLESPISYDNKNSVTDIMSIELLSCFITDSLYKNNFSEYPYIILKINEIEDVLHINGTPIGGFCYIMWEKVINNKFYSYVNKDKMFGVYKTNKKFSLNKISLQFFTPNGQGISTNNLKVEKNDIFNLTLKISRRII